MKVTTYIPPPELFTDDDHIEVFAVQNGDQLVFLNGVNVGHITEVTPDLFHMVDEDQIQLDLDDGYAATAYGPVDAALAVAAVSKANAVRVGEWAREAGLLATGTEETN